MLVSCWSPWDLKNIAFSLRGSSNSSFSLFSPRRLLGNTKIIPQSSKLHAQAPRKVSQRSPRALWSIPGEPQELPKITPGALGGHPRASKRSPGVVLEASGPHFGTPRARLGQFFLLVQSLSALFVSLFYLASLFFSADTSLLSSVVSLQNALVSLLASRFSSISPAARRFSRSDWDPPRRCHVRAARNGVSDQGLRSLALRKRMLPLTRHKTRFWGCAAET